MEPLKKKEQKFQPRLPSLTLLHLFTGHYIFVQMTLLYLVQSRHKSCIILECIFDKFSEFPVDT